MKFAVSLLPALSSYDAGSHACLSDISQRHTRPFECGDEEYLFPERLQVVESAVLRDAHALSYTAPDRFDASRLAWLMKRFCQNILPRDPSLTPFLAKLRAFPFCAPVAADALRHTVRQSFRSSRWSFVLWCLPRPAKVLMLSLVRSFAGDNRLEGICDRDDQDRDHVLDKLDDNSGRPPKTLVLDLSGSPNEPRRGRLVAWVF